jgi:hypothetical protein
VAQSPAPQKPSPYGVSTGAGGRLGNGEADVVGGVAEGSKGKGGGVPAPSTKSSLGFSNERSRDASPQKEQRQTAAPQEISRYLSDARTAHGRNNLTQEIALAQQALDLGATGNQRAEALQRICEAFDSLGQESRADPYCNALLAEFKGTAAAQRIAQRRQQPSMNPSPARVKAEKKAADFEEQKAEPAKASSGKKNAASEAAY